MKHGYAALGFGVLVAHGVQAAPVPALSPHVPDLVRDHSAPLLGPAPADHRMELAISLKLRDEAGLRALLARTYNPASPSFRHYLSVAEFTARFGPTEADYAAMRQFAAANHLSVRNQAANRLVLDVSGRVEDVENAFHLLIGQYRHPTENRIFFAPDREPTADLAVPVLHVAGLDNADLPVSHVTHDATPGLKHTGSGPDGNFIGSDIRAAYYGNGPLTGAGQSLGLLEYKGYDLADVRTYFSQVGQALTVPIVGVSLNGARLTCSGSCDDSEQVLDMEEAISMAPGLQQLVIYVGHTDVSMLNQMAVDNTSRQLSSSWGWRPDPEADDPIFEEFAAQGQSFLDATGDYGSRLRKGVVWPADDQNVTGVGGTDLITEGPGGPWLREIGWKFSGGGASPDHIAIPDYQLSIVNKRNGASHTLRNVPDIAGDADVDNYSCFDGGCYTGNGGTSYAAPLLAGFIALANEQGAQTGLPALGFLNPALYAIGAGVGRNVAFHDQHNGDNGKYRATRGFDLVTGFGSPHGQALIDSLEAAQ